MSRHVVPAIVFVTLTIMFGSSYLTQKYAPKPQRYTAKSMQLAGLKDVPERTMGSDRQGAR